VVTCPSCGEENPERARFCVACGTALTEAPVRLDEERKYVTVMFVELTGFHRTTGASDPEDLRRVLEPYHAKVSRVVANHGGTVDKFMGATVLCLFGAPIAHEDDPERGVRTALKIREAIAQLNEAEPSLELAVRVGVNTGEAVVARPGAGPQVGEAVTGDVVNTASRLQTAAEPGEILVGEETYQAIAPVFEWREHEPVLAKGKAEPVRTWVTLAPLGRYGVDLRPRPPTPFIGRRDELAILGSAFRRAAAESTVQLVTIAGEAGVGKTRLIQELSDIAEEWPGLVRWRQGRSLPYGEGLSFWALGEIVKADAGILESDPPASAQRKLSRAIEPYVADPTEREWLRARLAPLVGVEGESFDAPREELFTAWRRWFEVLAMDSPFVAVFEDFQWADDAMLGFVEYLVDWAVGLPLLVVCAARPELYDRHAAWGGGRRNSTSIALPPLSDTETAMLLGALLEGSVLAPGTQAALIDRCGGNPLYAEEFVRMLRDRGLLGADGAVEETAVTMPQTVQLLIGGRIDTLPPTEKDVLQDAAVVGKVFWAGAVEAVSGLPEDVVVRALHESVKREFVRRVRTSSLEGQEEYAFNQTLVQEVAYGQIPRSARADKHVAVARWLRAVAADRVFEVAELLAHHFGKALEYRRATEPGRDVSGLEAAAGAALMMAGDRAKRLDAGRAVELFRRAREALPVGDPERTRALLEAAEAAEEAGRLAEADAAFDEAIAEYRARQDRLGLGEALARRARSVQRVGRAALELLEEAVELLETQPPGPELARTYTRMGGHVYVAGDNAGAIPWTEKAIAFADELGLEEEAVLALQYRGAARAGMGERAGLDDLREALRRGLEIGLGFEVAITYNNLAYQLWFWEGPAAALRMWEEMTAFCRTRGFATLGMWAGAGTLESLFDLGEWDRVLEMTEEMEAWDREHGRTRVTVIALTYRAWIHLRRGELEEASQALEELLPGAREVGYAEFLAPGLVIAAEISLARGDVDRALAFTREFVEITSAQPEYRGIYLPVVVRTLVDAGAVSEAERLVGQTPEPTSERPRLSLRSTRAVVAAARGDHEAAVAMFEEALPGWAAYGFGLEEARVLLGLARSLLALGRAGEARPRLIRARELASRLRAAPLLEEIDDLLRGAEARTG
jgi:class 3 adenylate cyclase/tetratricopeptide (TPR) repeat protein